MGVALYALGGLPWLVWGGFVRSILVLHTTWLVNSATHIWGYRSHPDPRPLDEPLVGRAADLRRRLAQQPPRLPDLGTARPAVVGSRHDLLDHPPDVVLRPRLRDQTAQVPECRTRQDWRGSPTAATTRPNWSGLPIEGRPPCPKRLRDTGEAPDCAPPVSLRAQCRCGFSEILAKPHRSLRKFECLRKIARFFPVSGMKLPCLVELDRS